MVHLITYDLHRPGQNYQSLHDAIKRIGPWWHHLQSTWMVETNATPQQVFEYLMPHVDANDNLIVIQVQHNYWGRLPNEAWNWLRARNY